MQQVILFHKNNNSLSSLTGAFLITNSSNVVISFEKNEVTQYSGPLFNLLNFLQDIQ